MFGLPYIGVYLCTYKCTLPCFPVPLYFTEMMELWNLPERCPEEKTYHF